MMILSWSFSLTSFLSVPSVGATQNIPETTANYSSGGFSNIFAQPDYQADAVSAYLDFWGDKNKDLFK